MYQDPRTNNNPNMFGASVASGDPQFFLEDVSLRFGKYEVLKSIQLTIERGEVIFLTGVSGAGKTTLLRLLSGELLPCNGRIVRPKGFLTRVFQDLRLIDHLTCEDNLRVAYDASAYGQRREFETELGDLCRFLNVSDRLHMKVRDVNGGMKQKVAIIRALLSRPEILLADEPTSSLDLDNAKKLFELLNIYNVKRGTTVVWASHNRELVKYFSGRIVHLDAGRVIYSGHACFI